jgi:polysaccharide biosynthesis protein PslH
VDVPEELPSPGTGAPLFLASLDASANIEALTFLVEQVLPHLPAEMTIDVAGSNARPAVHRLLEVAGPRLRFLGQVPDAPAALRAASMLLIPLLSGGGTRLKALEAFAVGTPVVSTAKGVEGIPVDSGQHAMIADRAAEFAAAIVNLAADRSAAAGLALAARELVEKQFTWSALGDEFTGILRSI